MTLTLQSEKKSAKRMLKKTATILIHLALAIIVAGACVTHFCGIQGHIELQEGACAQSAFTVESGPSDGLLPFSLELERAEEVYYPGTGTPANYRSHLRADSTRCIVEMNRPGVIDGWRFCQAGMSGGRVSLTVTHDPWGIAVTFTGYALLGLGMLLYLLSTWTMRLRPRAALAVAALLMGAAASASAPRTVQKPLGRNLGRVLVYWNDRVCPMQTMAMDVTAKLYGSTTYRGLTPEQVLAGWLFNYDAWLRDYDATHPAASDSKAEGERRALISWLGTGEAFRIYPYRAATGRMEWISPAGQRPSEMPPEQWAFMQQTMPEVQRLLDSGQNNAANQRLKLLMDGQRRYAGAENLPSQSRLNAEHFYNSYVRLVPLALLALLLGALTLWRGNRRGPASRIAAGVLAAAIGAVLLLRGYVGGHLPLSNGCETMLFMAFCAAAAAPWCSGAMVRGALAVVSALALFVAAMASKTPQIASLMPVLASPLLSVHVMLIMASYVMFMLMAVLAVAGLLGSGERCGHMAAINRRMLTPAVFLLAAGIFVGAVWANESWGRYWGWDPKETCALVTMLIYALPIHRLRRVHLPNGRSARTLLPPRALNWYLLLSISAVLFTYFGANYLLPGLHSYA